MRYYSTMNTMNQTDLRTAVMRSIAPDGGVYMPVSIPLIPRALFNNIPDMSLKEIAYVACTTLFGSDIPAAQINSIVQETLTFDIPMRQVSDSVYALELFHGPTGSFKDIGARFMARVVDHYLNHCSDGPSKLNVLVATSGDTGCAVTNAFANIPGVRVFILHPKGPLLRVPHESFRSTSANVVPVSVRGSFDDCQRLVKEAYADEELNRRAALTSANSINIARLLPQTFYYLHAYARLIEHGADPTKIVMSTPCGNLGNLTAALFARQMGLPINRIIAAGHDNERLWGEMKQGQLAVSTFNSRALSTNLARINCLMRQTPQMADMIECHTFNDAEISEEIRSVYHSSSYLMDRNSAMASRALKAGMRPGEAGVFLATAHPDKYRAKLREIIGEEIALTPDHATHSPHRHGHFVETSISPTLLALKRFLLEN